MICNTYNRIIDRKRHNKWQEKLLSKEPKINDQVLEAATIDAEGKKEIAN